MKKYGPAVTKEQIKRNVFKASRIKSSEGEQIGGWDFDKSSTGKSVNQRHNDIHSYPLRRLKTGNDGSPLSQEAGDPALWIDKKKKKFIGRSPRKRL